MRPRPGGHSAPWAGRQLTTGEIVIESQETAPADRNKAISSIVSDLNNIRDNRPTASLSAGKADKTSDTIKKIITAARDIFTHEGHGGLSLRKVADEAGIAVGNLTYHFPTKRSLLNAILCEALADYIDDHLKQFETGRDTPFEILLNVVEFYVRNARESHRFFYQMWGYAGCDEQAKDMVRTLYRPIGRFVYYLVRSANPKLNDVQIRQAVLQIFSLEEGYKLFIGMGPEDDTALSTAEQDIRTLTERIVFPEGRADHSPAGL